MADTNDFREIFSTFQKVVDELRTDPAQLISEDSVKLAEDVSRKTAERTKHQKEFARSVGEGIVLSKVSAAIQERDVLIARSKEGIKASELETLKAELSILDSSILANQSILEQINAQVEQYGEITDHSKNLSEFEKKVVELNIEKAKLLALEAKDLSPEIVAKKKEELDVQIQLNEQLELNRKFLEHQQAVHERLTEIFGVNISTVKRQFTEIRTLASTTAGRLTLIAGAIAALGKQALEAFRTIRAEAGTSLQQTFALSKVGIRAIGQSYKDGIILNHKAAAELTGQLASHMGDLDHVTAQTVANAARLNIVIGLSAEQAAELVATFEHTMGMTPEVSKDVIETADQMARINKIAPQKMFAQMAANSDLMARGGERGAASLLRAAAFATKIAVDLAKFEQFADAALDVTGMIEGFTKLSTLGLDLGDPFKFAQLAESGQIEDLQQEIQARLEGIDLTRIGRTRQKALEQVTGFNIAELQRIQRGEAIRAPGEVTAAELETVKAQQKFDALVTSMGAFLGSINLATIALTALGLAAGIGGVGGIGRAAGRVGRFGKGIFGRLFGVGAAAAGTAGGAVATGGATAAGAAGGAGLLATGGVAAGGLAGGAGVATGALELANKFLGTNFDTLADFARARRANVVTAEQQQSLATALERSRRTREGRAAQATAPAESTEISGQLEELIKLFKQGGITVVLDGKKVGRLIAAAQPRDSQTAILG